MAEVLLCWPLRRTNGQPDRMRPGQIMIVLQDVHRRPWDSLRIGRAASESCLGKTATVFCTITGSAINGVLRDAAAYSGVGRIGFTVRTAKQAAAHQANPNRLLLRVNTPRQLSYEMLPHWSIRYVSTISTETQSALSMERVRKPPPPSANQWPENGGACYARPAGHGRNLGALKASNIRAAHCTQASLFPWFPPLWALSFTAASGENPLRLSRGPRRTARNPASDLGDAIWISPSGGHQVCGFRGEDSSELAGGYAAQGHKLVQHTALRARKACLS
jgi:hypothetical protein